MHWHSLEEFLAMGGYALYVWGSVLLTAAAIGIEVLQLRARRRAILAELADLAAESGGAAGSLPQTGARA